MLRIEKDSTNCTTFVRLCGRVQAQDIAGIQTEMRGGCARTILDLGDVTLVDLEVVRFLAASEDTGVELARCPPYIREWILRERSEGMIRTV